MNTIVSCDRPGFISGKSVTVHLGIAAVSVKDELKRFQAMSLLGANNQPRQSINKNTLR